MPTYTLKHKETGEVKDYIVSIATMEEMTGEEGEYVQIIGAPMTVTQVGGTLKKAGGDWQNLLQTIKKGSGRNSTIKT